MLDTCGPLNVPPNQHGSGLAPGVRPPSLADMSQSRLIPGKPIDTRRATSPRYADVITRGCGFSRRVRGIRTCTAGPGAASSLAMLGNRPRWSSALALIASSFAGQAGILAAVIALLVAMVHMSLSPPSRLGSPAGVPPAVPGYYAALTSRTDP